MTDIKNSIKRLAALAALAVATALPAAAEDATAKELLKDYEKFADEYVALVERVKADEKDAMVELGKVAPKLREWRQKVPSMPEADAKRVTEKIANAMKEARNLVSLGLADIPTTPRQRPWRSQAAAPAASEGRVVAVSENGEVVQLKTEPPRPQAESPQTVAPSVRGLAEDGDSGGSQEGTEASASRPTVEGRIEPPFGGYWEEAILDVIDRLAKIETVKSIRVNPQGSDDAGSELPLKASRKDKSAFIAERLGKASNKKSESKTFRYVSGKEQQYSTASVRIVADEIIIDALPFSARYDFYSEPGLFVAYPGNVVVDPKTDIAMPLFLQEVTLTCKDPTAASVRMEGIAKAFDRYVPVAAEIHHGIWIANGERTQAEAEKMVRDDIKRGNRSSLWGRSHTRVDIGTTIRYGYSVINGSGLIAPPGYDRERFGSEC